MDLLTVEQVLDFINTYYADDRLGVEVPALYSQDTYEVFWYREDYEPRWTVGTKNSSDLQKIDTADLVDFLNKNKLDLVEFQVNLLDRILLNIGTIAIIVKQARIMLGDSLIDQAIEKVEEFYKEIDNTIEEMIVTDKDKNSKSESTSKAKSSKQENKKSKKSKSSSPKKASLKLIKSDHNEE